MSITTSAGMVTLQPAGESMSGLAGGGKYPTALGRGSWVRVGRTQDCDGGCEAPVPEEGLAVDLGIGIVGVGVTGRSFNACPAPNGAIPAHDGIEDTGVVLGRGRIGRRVLLLPCKGWGLTPTPLGKPYLRGVRHRAGLWTRAHAHQLPPSPPPQWRRWGPAVRTQGGGEVEDNGNPKHCPTAGPPRPALTTAVLSMEAVGWMYTFPATEGSCVRGGTSQEHSLLRSGEVPAHGSPLPPHFSPVPCGAAPKAAAGVRGVPRIIGPPGLFWASLSGWLLLYWFR